MKMPAFKDILRFLKLKVSGKKAELVERILDYEEYLIVNGLPCNNLEYFGENFCHQIEFSQHK